MNAVLINILGSALTERALLYLRARLIKMIGSRLVGWKVYVAKIIFKYAVYPMLVKVRNAIRVKVRKQELKYNLLKADAQAAAVREENDAEENFRIINDMFNK